ncbi:MAG: selenocysteine-specific translation elongation factor, partial [candidate division Zixibacteria bacterium]|nr:selenocysteine-specific translation elongation factor [candidate division Zixibacteria bacterium]
MRHLTIGTAGHVDHGKSALVEALTGTHPDRLAEEQARGMTIDLGFAFMPLSDGREAPIVDVPGHERFLRTMVAGVSGIDLVLFIVAADEGIMPQTVEHLGALRYMGVEHGIVVLTKKDLADDEWLLLVEDEVRTLTTGTFLAHAPILGVSALTGEGIAELRAAIETALEKTPLRQDSGMFRLPIDRVFTMKGFGTVVAGTIASGTVSTDDTLELLPAQTTVRVRGIQSHNRALSSAGVGQRAALNLSGVKVSDIERGHELATPGHLRPAIIMDVQIEALGTLDTPLKNGIRIRLHKGTSETIGRMIFLDQETLEPGQTGYAQFKLETPAVAERDERFIIRSFSSLRLLGGGRIIDPCATRHRRFRETVLRNLETRASADPDTLVAQVFLESYGADRIKTYADLLHQTHLSGAALRESLSRLTASETLIPIGEGLIHVAYLEMLKREIPKRLKELHTASHLRDTVSRASLRAKMSTSVPDAVFEYAIRRLAASDTIVLVGNEVKLPDHRVVLNVQERQIWEAFETLKGKASFEAMSMNDVFRFVPDARPEVMKAMVGYLFEQGVLVEFAENNVLHRQTLDAIKEKLIAYLREHGTVRAAEFRDCLNISRSHATALLDYFYDAGVTQRETGTHRLKGSVEGL